MLGPMENREPAISDHRTVMARLQDADKKTRRMTAEKEAVKTLLGFTALVLYAFSMLAWLRPDAMQLCRSPHPFSHGVAQACATARDAVPSATK